MVRRKTLSRTWTCCLALTGLFLISSTISYAEEYNLGNVFQAKGEMSFLEFAAPNKLTMLKVSDKVRTGGSYLTRDYSNATFKLVGDTWLRASVRTKFYFEFEPNQKVLTINLQSGSVKVLFSSFLSKQQINKIIINSADAVFESVEGKFSVVRNNLTDESSVYVEKGMVNASLIERGGPRPAVPVHKHETTSIKDHDQFVASPSVMTNKELRFLKSAFYIGGKSEDF